MAVGIMTILIATVAHHVVLHVKALEKKEKNQKNNRMEFKYLIVCQSAGKHYLLMSHGQQGWAIQGYPNKEEIMKDFSGYTSAWTRSYESSMSACIGMMNMVPVAIKAPENIEDIRPYIVQMKLIHVSGGALGRGYHGMEVTEDILKLKEFDIWGETMKAAGIA
jgi:hypothetical protein